MPDLFTGHKDFFGDTIVAVMNQRKQSFCRIVSAGEFMFQQAIPFVIDHLKICGFPFFKITGRLF
jgi:hypothetical protein